MKKKKEKEKGKECESLKVGERETGAIGGGAASAPPGKIPQLRPSHRAADVGRWPSPLNTALTLNLDFTHIQVQDWIRSSISLVFRQYFHPLSDSPPRADIYATWPTTNKWHVWLFYTCPLAVREAVSAVPLPSVPLLFDFDFDFVLPLFLTKSLFVYSCMSPQYCLHWVRRICSQSIIGRKSPAPPSPSARNRRRRYKTKPTYIHPQLEHGPKTISTLTS